MNFKSLSKVVKAVSTHVSRDKSRLDLMVIEVARSAADQIRLIATDGHRAIVAYVDAPPEVLASLPDTGAARYWDRDADRRLALGVVPGALATLPPGATYPDVRATMAIPADDEPRTVHHVGANPRYLSEAGDACTAIAKACGDGKPGVKVTLPPDGYGPIHVRWSREHNSVHCAVMPMRLNDDASREVRGDGFDCAA